MNKITIVGAGRVGESTAQFIAGKDMCREVVLLDIRAGAAEGAALEMPCTGNCTVGSNPTPSAIFPAVKNPKVLPGGEKGSAARRRPKFAREAYSMYVERANEGANDYNMLEADQLDRSRPLLAWGLLLGGGGENEEQDGQRVDRLHGRVGSRIESLEPAHGHATDH